MNKLKLSAIYLILYAVLLLLGEFYSHYFLWEYDKNDLIFIVLQMIAIPVIANGLWRPAEWAWVVALAYCAMVFAYYSFVLISFITTGILLKPLLNNFFSLENISYIFSPVILGLLFVAIIFRCLISKPARNEIRKPSIAFRKYLGR